MTSRLQSPLSRREVRAIFHRSGIFACTVALLLPATLSANPTGGGVVAGSATIAGQGTSAVTIHQSSNTAIINWQTFSINSGETTSFLQPSATSAVLNRVLGGQTSLINGTLSANGQVYLINGNGIIVGPGGVINAGAFTASTRDITNADFLSGNLHFTGSSAAGVQNLGTINALGGNVALIGQTVDNEGTITAPKGTAALVAANDVLLAQANADGSTVTVNPASTTPKATGLVGVKNGGAITAAAAELKAANGNIYALAVQNQGVIRATTVTHQGGHIWLTSDSGTVSNSGMLNASATVAGGKGGSVTLKSKTGLASHTGQIIAQGGAGGVGGNADVSGANLQFTGTVDLTAPHGTMGNLLLDPTDVDIMNGGGTDLAGASIDPGAIVTALNSSNVTISASNSITVFDPINASGNSNPGNLTLDAPTLQLDAPILLNGTLSGTPSQIFLGAGGLVQNGIDASPTTGGQLNLAPGAIYTPSTQLLINKVITILGNGAILSGQNGTRIMEIDGGTVEVVNTTFTDGTGAGTTGASGAGNTGFGGAVMVYTQNSSANVEFLDDSFIGNSASGGGAIMNISISGGGNSVVIENCTIAGNSAVNGSALYAEAGFGGSATFGLKSDTIAENSGNGAIYSTVLSSGNASVTINDTILAGNTNGGTESDYVDGGGGALSDFGYNLYGQNGNAGGFLPSATGDILLNGPIANELGPPVMFGPTPTLPLLSTSLSLESGDPAFNGSPDQNGVPRGDAAAFTGSNADIGASEAQYVNVQADPITTLYGTPPSFTYTITSGPAAALLSGTPALITPATNAGFYGEDIGQGTVTASAPYVVNFTDGDLTITQRPVTVLPDSGQDKVYGTADPALTYTTSPADAVSGLVNGDTLTGSPSYNGAGQYAPVGNYQTNLGTVADSTGNYIVSLSAVAPTFAITPRDVIINPDAGQTKTYGNPDPALTYSIAPTDTLTGLVNGDTLTGALDELGSVPGAPVGSYPFIAGTLGNPNYVVSINSSAPSFNITPRPATVTIADGQGKTYGESDPPLAYSVSGLVNGDTLSGVASYDGASQFANVGNYPTNLGTLGNPNYVLMLGSTSTFTISPATLYYAADQVQVPVGGTEFPPFTGTVVGFVGEDNQANATTGTLVFSTAATPSAPQGYYEIDGSGLASPTGNYTFAQAATNVAALVIGNPPPRGTMSGGSTSNPTTPAETQAAASTPNTPTSQAIAQTSTPPNSGEPSNPNPAVPAGPSTTTPPTVPPTPPDINVSMINPNESIDSTPISSTTTGGNGAGGPGGGGGGGGGDATAAGGADATPVASGSSFSPDVGATKVTGGQSVTMGGPPGVPPPAAVTAQLNSILGLGAQDTLSGALDTITTASTDTSTSTSTPSSPSTSASASTPTDDNSSSSASTTPGSPDQSGQSASAAAVAAAAASPNAYANGPIIRGPSAMVAPGQTVTLGGGRASAGPAPVFVQNAFNQGFSPDSRNALAKAAGL